MKINIGAAVLLLCTFSLSGQVRKSVTLYGPHADKLVEACRDISARDSGVSSNYSWCLGFLAGLVDGSEVASRQTPRTFPVCIPLEATIGETAKIIVKYGDDHPEYLHQEAVNFANEALKRAFPCPLSK